MTPVGTLAAIVIVPLVLLTVLRINAALVFLSLCLGNVLVQFVATDANDLLSLVSSAHATATVQTAHNNIKLILLLLPVILTAVFMIRTIRGHGRSALNTLPSAGVAMLGALLVVPLLPPGLSHNIVGSSLWHQISHVQDLIVGASALICLLALWMQRPKATHEDKHHKHKG